MTTLAVGSGLICVTRGGSDEQPWSDLSMKALVCALGSAACALGCLGVAIMGAVQLLLDWQRGLILLVVAVGLGIAARRLDRSKMRAIYGRQEGDRLHEQDDESLSPAERAERDALAYVRVGGLPVGKEVEPASAKSK